MAAKKKDEAEKVVVDPASALSSFLKEKKDDHFNFEEDHPYKVKCSSLLLTYALSGGLSAGAHRFSGPTGGGKTSCALDFMYHFLNTPSEKGCSRRGIYIKAEGRLSENVQKRSGIKFVYDSDEWVDGTCFVFESNIYEAVFDLKRRMIVIPNLEIFFITDSTDSLIKRDDAKKSEEESQTVAGGALILSTFLKKVGLAMSKRGHIDVYISQLRDHVKIDKYDVSAPRLGKASGARALEHQGDVVLEFLPRYGGDLILESGKKSKTVGHFCKCKVLKTDNENYTEVKYPVLYGRTTATSVWAESEIKDMLIMWELITRGGSWYNFNETFLAELKTEFPESEIPERFQGGDSIIKFLEDNKEIQSYIFDKIVKLLP